MNVRRIVAATVACGLTSFALSAASAQAAKAPKPPEAKAYTYCVSNGIESECFAAPFEIVRRTQTWTFETTAGTYTSSGRSYTFRETGGPSELVGTKSGSVISGTLRENGKNTEFTFTLTPRP
jgi:hypothetical protein